MERLRRFRENRKAEKVRWEHITFEQELLFISTVNRLLAELKSPLKIKSCDVSIYTQDGNTLSVELGSLFSPDLEKQLPTEFEGHHVTYCRYAEFHDRQK